jgi:hypothetical protein
MAITYHPDAEVIAGISWTIAGTLFDANGLPFDVTNAVYPYLLFMGPFRPLGDCF